MVTDEMGRPPETGGGKEGEFEPLVPIPLFL